MPLGFITDYGQPNDPTGDSASLGIGKYRRPTGAWDNPLGPDSLAISPDVEAQFVRAGIRPGDPVVLTTEDGQQILRRWDDRVSPEYKGKPLTGRFDFYSPEGPHPLRDKRVIGFAKADGSGPQQVFRTAAAIPISQPANSGDIFDAIEPTAGGDIFDAITAPALAKLSEAISGKPPDIFDSIVATPAGAPMTAAPAAEPPAGIFDFLKRIPAAMAESGLSSLAGGARLLQRYPTVARIANPLLNAPPSTYGEAANLASDAAQGAADYYGVNPANEGTLPSQVAQGVGGLLAFGPALATGPLAPAVMGIQALGGAKEADYQRNLEQGLPEEQAQKASDISAAVKSGATLPLYMLGSRLAAMAGGRFFDRLANQVIANSLASAGGRGIEAAYQGQPVGEAMMHQNIPGAVQDLAFALSGAIPERARPLAAPSRAEAPSTAPEPGPAAAQPTTPPTPPRAKAEALKPSAIEPTQPPPTYATTPTGIEPSSNQPEYTGVPQGTNLPAHGTEVREKAGGPTERGGGAGERASAPEPQRAPETPPAPPAAEANAPAQKPSVHEIVPALKIEGKLVEGKQGDTHRDILNRWKQGKTEDQAATAEANFDAPDNRNLFYNPGTKQEISREQLRQWYGVSDSQGLRDLQAKTPKGVTPNEQTQEKGPQGRGPNVLNPPAEESPPANVPPRGGESLAPAKPPETATPETVEAPPEVTRAAEKIASKPESSPAKMRVQKEYLLSALDEAIKKAPEGEPERPHYPKHSTEGVDVAEHAEIAARNKAKFGVVHIEVPGDGDFQILNTKEALSEFRKMAEKKFPTTLPGEIKPKGSATMRTEPSVVPPLGRNKTPADLVRLASVARSTDPTRYVLNFVMSNGKELVATDGRRLIRIEGNAGGTVKEPKFFGEKGAEKKFITTYEEDPKTKKRTAIPPPKYPNIEQVTPDPKKQFKIAEIDTGGFLKLLYQAREMTSDKGKAVKLWKDAKGNIGITANNPDVGEFAGGGNDPNTSEFVSAYDVNFLIDAMKTARALGHDKVTWSGERDGGPDRNPATFDAKGYKYVLMPMWTEDTPPLGKPTHPLAEQPAPEPTQPPPPEAPKAAAAEAPQPESQTDRFHQEFDDRLSAWQKKGGENNTSILSETARTAKMYDYGPDEVYSNFVAAGTKPHNAEYAVKQVWPGWLKGKPEEFGAPVREQPTTAATARPSDPFERARAGDESAFADLEEQFRERYGQPREEHAIATGGRAQVHTQAAFEAIFDAAYKAKDFDAILDAVKASDKGVWSPLLKKFFRQQATDPEAANKAEWMRSIFNGTRPVDAQPPRPQPAPTAPPSRPGPAPRPTGPGPTGGPRTTPPPTGAPPPPMPPPRIEPAPIHGAQAKSPYQIIAAFEKAIGKAQRVRNMARRLLGLYRPGSTMTAVKFAGDLDSTAHELAGHWLDDKHGVAKPWYRAAARSPYDRELERFWIHGSIKPSDPLRYKRAEGVAEFVRAYVVNPAEAMRQAPTFGPYWERTMSPDDLTAVRQFSKDVREWIGADPLQRAGMNIRTEPPGLTERLKKSLFGKGYGFDVTAYDKLRQRFDDNYWYAIKANRLARELRGKNTPLTLKPEENFELLAHLLAGHDDRMETQMKHGLLPLTPTLDRQGTPVHLKDPQTGEAMNLQWLLKPLQEKDFPATEQRLRDASAYMVAQRTLEKANQLGRQSNLSGLGAGIMSDTEAATQALDRVRGEPGLEARLNEAARRYRLWAEQNLQTLVDAGRLSPSEKQRIMDRNELYVDMHRLSDEFESGASMRAGKTHIGQPTQPLKRFKGSTLELDNVYANLLEQTDAIQKEAFCNKTYEAFTDMLDQVRQMHQGSPIDLDQIGSKATAEDRNTIPVYKNGEATHWKFDPSVYESLKGLGDLRTDALTNFLSKPSQFAKTLIVHGPGFMTRNPIRDTIERSIVSRTGGKPWDILQGYNEKELDAYSTFGGGQFGNYIRDRNTWNRELVRGMRELSKDPENIFLAPGKLWHAWTTLAQDTEKIGRLAEYRRAFKYGKEMLGYDDYNAGLYAAGEARGLIDFAQLGSWMRVINRLVPFSGARMRGLIRSAQGAKEHPGLFATRWALYALLPTLGTMAFNRRDEKTWEEYSSLPAWQRDFFWNFKVGPVWLRIPKPHELGVMAGGIERAVSAAMGDKHAYEGYGRSISSALTPIGSPVEASGPLRVPLELMFNKDTFRGREIVPSWEASLDMDLRKGKEDASAVGRGIAKMLNTAGLTIDPRQVDYFLQSYGGIGQAATEIGRKGGGPPVERAVRSLGYTMPPAGYTSRDVQWLLEWARRRGQTQTADIRQLKNMQKELMGTRDSATRDRLATQMRAAAAQMRAEREGQPDLAAPKPPASRPKRVSSGRGVGSLLRRSSGR